MHKLIIGLLFISAQATAQSLQLQPVNFSQVTINDQFWSPRQQTVSRVTLPVCIYQTEVKTPRIRNFEKVARKQGERHEGIYFDDSDVYKALEAISYSLKTHPDAELQKTADEWIDKIAAAQQPDGYLNTFYTLNGLDKRWTDMEKHEDYCAGHLFEAAVAYYNTTGKTKLLDVATRMADHIDVTFRQQNRHWVSGHEEIELALVKLYKATGNKKYLTLADWFLQQRGHKYGRGVIWDDWKNAAYCQDSVPVREQRKITGHAVRAMYLYTGAADVGAALKDSGYMTAMEAVWEDVVHRNMYLTGGIGSSGHNEGFTENYDLPNEHAYCETCASVGMVFWNQRMNGLTGDAKYIDVLERSLYNGALDGLSLSGDRFFYGNPLSSSGQHSRSEWFGTACCPSNISRLVASVGDYVYAKTDEDIWVNLFVGSTANLQLKNNNVYIQQQTNYPWEGNVNITVSPKRTFRFPLHLRIPGWAQNVVTPGSAYYFKDMISDGYKIKVNGKDVEYSMDKGYAVINRTWKKGDVITLNLPMEVRKVAAIDKIKENKNRIALQRGPLVYCLEHIDNNGQVKNIIVPEQTAFKAEMNPGLLNGVVTLKATVPVVKLAADGESITTEKQTVTAIPYFSWANRGQGEMEIWIPTKLSSFNLKP
ncbi:glycoside hydrolase family 127 protein [Chitinophaga silvatica]|uniref:Glycoside hydrolase family 127 protein n=1 Tax=Chitinophaga silvatica TaxID=2282649 RepID=A0A3E1Y708_9BACT|nr:beta-L-arabinofuranosidase domain-containing protein [Chitinophaga silvatica]RFS20722.1 glycoside hydrolase family 127 protein [Chitinophaga silvatica]